MNMKKLLPLLTLVLALTACGKKPAEQLVVGIMPDFDSIPFVVAMQQGYLPDGVELTVFRSPVERDSALYAGSLDGTISDVLAVCLAREGGLDVTVTSKTDGRYGVVTSRPLDSVRELEGTEIGMSLNTIIEYFTDQALTAAGGDTALLQKTSVPQMPARLELLKNGQIDAIAVPEPYVTAAVAQGGYLLCTSEDAGVNPGIMLFTRAAVDEKAAEVEALYEAYNRAVDYVNQNDPADFMPGVIEYLGLPESAGAAVLPSYTHAAMPDEREVTLAVDWLVEKGLLEAAHEYEGILWKRAW